LGLMKRTADYLSATLILAILMNLVIPAGLSQDRPKYLDLLRLIYIEVKEMGARPGEGFIQGQFFIGKPDDDDTNKDIHVIILIQGSDGSEKMKIQVTYMERTRENPTVKYAKETKNIVCIVQENAVKLQSSDYAEREMKKLGEDILKSVRDKKRLLKIRSALLFRARLSIMVYCRKWQMVDTEIK